MPSDSAAVYIDKPHMEKLESLIDATEPRPSKGSMVEHLIDKAEREIADEALKSRGLDKKRRKAS